MGVGAKQAMQGGLPGRNFRCTDHPICTHGLSNGAWHISNFSFGFHPSPAGSNVVLPWKPSLFAKIIHSQCEVSKIPKKTKKHKKLEQFSLHALSQNRKQNIWTSNSACLAVLLTRKWDFGLNAVRAVMQDLQSSPLPQTNCLLQHDSQCCNFGFSFS